MCRRLQRALQRPSVLSMSRWQSNGLSILVRRESKNNDSKYQINQKSVHTEAILEKRKEVRCLFLMDGWMDVTCTHMHMHTAAAAAAVDCFVLMLSSKVSPPSHRPCSRSTSQLLMTPKVHFSQNSSKWVDSGKHISHRSGGPAQREHTLGTLTRRPRRPAQCRRGQRACVLTLVGKEKKKKLLLLSSSCSVFCAVRIKGTRNVAKVSSKKVFN